MAQKKAGGSSRNGRDSAGRRLGLKCGDGQYVKPGSIVVRQRGTKFFPGEGMDMGRDHTIFSLGFGKINFERKGSKRFVSLNTKEQEGISS